MYMNLEIRYINVYIRLCNIYYVLNYYLQQIQKIVSMIVAPANRRKNCTVFTHTQYLQLTVCYATNICIEKYEKY